MCHDDDQNVDIMLYIKTLYRYLLSTLVRVMSFALHNSCIVR